MSKPEVSTFPDTNTFLHYQTFDDIDWPSLVGNAPVVLCISRTVMSELEAKKFDQKISQRKRERVKKLAVKMDKMLAAGGTVREGVRIQLMRHPSKESAPPDLNVEHPDDAHVAAAYEQQQRGTQVYIVSADPGVRNTARLLGLELLDLPEGSELPPEPDENEAELSKLRLEVAQLKAVKRPKLKVRFANGEPVASFQLRPHGSMSDKEIEWEVQDDLNLSAEQQKLEDLTLQVLGEPTGHREDLRKYYQRKRDYETQRELTIKIALTLFNDGEAPARGVHVLLEFPQRLIVETEPREEPKKPEWADRFKALSGYGDIELPKMIDVDAWELEGTKADLHRRTVVHSLHLELPALYVRPVSRDDREPFNIEGRVVATDPPLNESFQLHVTLDGKLR